MNKEKRNVLSMTKAQKAFDYAICNVSCKGNATKAKECIDKRTVCEKRNNFIKKINE